MSESSSSVCDKCKSKRSNAAPVTDRAMETRKFLSSARWKRLRDHIRVRDDFTCQRCLTVGIIRISKVQGGASDNREFPVDHIASRHLRPDLKWDPDNLELICPFCHAQKIAFEMLGFEIGWKTNQDIVVMSSPAMFVPEMYSAYNLVRRINKHEIKSILGRVGEKFVITERDRRVAFDTAMRLKAKLIYTFDEDFL